MTSKRFYNFLTGVIVLGFIALILVTFFGPNDVTTKTWPEVVDHGITWFGLVIAFVAYLKYRQ